MSLGSKTLFVTGASRGIGLAIALRAARDGANVAIAAKTVKPDPRLPGTIFTAAEEIEKAGGKALPLPCDIRDEQSVEKAVAETVAKFGGIDILVNNASAISLTGTLAHADEALRPDAPDQRARHLPGLAGVHPAPGEGREPARAEPLAAARLRRQVVRRPRRLHARQVRHVDLRLGMAAEFKDKGIAFNCLWPRTGIATAAIQNMLGGEEGMKRCRKPEIMADAAYAIFNRPARDCTGNFFIDDEVLAAEGVTDFDQYAVSPGTPLMPDFFVPAPGARTVVGRG